MADVERFAFCAFLEACRCQSPPAGQSFVETGPGVPDGLEWADREDFRELLISLFAQRVNALAVKRGVSFTASAMYVDLPPELSQVTA